MLFFIIENFVFFSTLLALGGCLAACLVRFGAARDWWRLSPYSLTRIYAAAILLPPVLALWLVLAALLPELWLGAENFQAAHAAPVHELHLLTDLTARFEPFLAIATVLFVILSVCFVVLTSVRSYFRIGAVVRLLEIEQDAPAASQIAVVEEIAAKYNLKVGLVTSKRPLTFVWGFWHSKLILSSGLLNALGEYELRGVIEHEAAHHRRRDNAFKFALCLASYSSLAFPLLRVVLRWHSEQVELVCDQIASAETRQPLEIASALVKLRRNCEPAIGFPAVSGFLTGEKNGIENRVKYLLHLDDAPPTAAALIAGKSRFETALLVLLFSGSLLAVLSLAPLLIHTLAENIIKFIG